MTYVVCIKIQSPSNAINLGDNTVDSRYLDFGYLE